MLTIAFTLPFVSTLGTLIQVFVDRIPICITQSSGETVIVNYCEGSVFNVSAGVHTIVVKGVSHK
jgi:hypothetical protein